MDPESKICCTCKIAKPRDSFYKNAKTKDGLQTECKDCKRKKNEQNKDSIREYNQQYHKEHKEKSNERDRNWYQNNKERAKESRRLDHQKNKDRDNETNRKWKLAHPEYDETHKEQNKAKSNKWKAKNKEYLREYNRQYKKNNRGKIAETENVRYQNDIQYKLAKQCRSRINSAMAAQLTRDTDDSIAKKNGSAIRDLGCTIEELKAYLESKFQPGMTWENWSYDGWHIDHIRPLASFDLTDRDQFLAAVHYSNLQPLWAMDNLKKSDKFPVDTRTKIVL